MKKLFGILAIAVIGLAACEGPMGPPGKDAESTQWFVRDYNVLSDQWSERTEEGDGYFFYYFERDVAIPQLNEFVFDKGFVGVYLKMNVRRDGRNIHVQRPLPYTIYGIDEHGNPYSENYSFEIRPGAIRFIVKYSDFDEIQPLSCTFHVVMMW